MFIRLSAFLHCLTEKFLRVGITGLNRERFFIMSDRLAQPALSVEAHREIVMRERAAWLALHDISIVQDGLVNLSVLQEHVREIRLRFWISRLSFESCFETATRALEFAFLHKRRAKLEIH